MLETTWLFVLALAHLTGLGAVVVGTRSESPASIAGALLAFVLFALAAMGATNVEVVTQTGSTVRQAHPGMGWYALGMALLSGVVAVYATLAWFGSQKEDTHYGNSYW